MHALYNMITNNGMSIQEHVVEPHPQKYREKVLHWEGCATMWGTSGTGRKAGE
jgi:hypothetical protein